MLKKSIYFGILLLISFLLFSGNSKDRIRKSGYFSKTVFAFWIKAFENKAARKQLHRENEELYTYNAELQKKVNYLEECMRSIQEQNIDLSDKAEGIIYADVVAVSGTYKSRNLIINRGSVHGVEINDAVIGKQSIIGKIISVSGKVSVVLPFDNTQFKTGVLTKSTRVQGLLENNEYGEMKMNMIQLGSNINVADTVITSNISSIFPKGYPVGIVNKVQNTSDNLYMSAIIKPFVKVENIEHVVILKHQTMETNDNGEFNEESGN